MNGPRAQRHEYNELYRAHQATTTQDALKMEMMLSILAANNNQTQAPINNPFTQQPRLRGENYGTAAAGRHNLRVPQQKVNTHNTLNGPGIGAGDRGQHAAADMFARPAEHIAPFTGRAAQPVNHTLPVSQHGSQPDGFRYQSPRLQSSSVVQHKFTKEDQLFAERRRISSAHAPGDSSPDPYCVGHGPGVCRPAAERYRIVTLDRIGPVAKAVAFAQVNDSPLSTHSAIDAPTPTKLNRLSVPSAASDESAPYDYFNEPMGDHEHFELPVTPTTSAYSEAINAAGADRLVHIVANLISSSPRVLHAALSMAEPLAPGAHLGSFIPSRYDISVKVLFAGRTTGDEFAYAHDIFQALGGCILVKGVNQYELDENDKIIVDRVSTRARAGRN
ncbi:hypothetical protein BKA62DRAFT_789369 [Auriculariales sp. MPI-PUGE-AT-0066]|nr:hypothetical protein BKA62DRAFT_789369 [Auriculariales sp. MPI-PUGE-AT-0066]